MPNKPNGGWASEEERQRVRREVWANALGWELDSVKEEEIVGGKGNRVVSAFLWYDRYRWRGERADGWIGTYGASV